MLPVIHQTTMSCQTSDSLWGLSKIPLFDASVSTNSELVAAAAEDMVNDESDEEMDLVVPKINVKSSAGRILNNVLN